MRYLPLTDANRSAMLQTIGVDNVAALFADVPAAAKLQAPLADLPNHQGELAVERHLGQLAAQNLVAGTVPFFLGAGVYRHHVPSTVDYLIQRGEFLTSYTPYQPEVSQGTLQYLFEFQTQVALITGMEVANASMYDGSTACAEAVMMATRITGRKKILLSGNLHPHYCAVTETIGQLSHIVVESLPVAMNGVENSADVLDETLAAFVVQTPDFFGHVHDFTKLSARCQELGVLLIVVVTEVVSLGLLPDLGAMGADIVAAEGQSLGNALNYGGPHVGLLATREKFVRQMPGRLCGETVDAEGKRGFVLTLSTREQHIRREKATSNICTNAGLCALAFTIHLSLLGEKGFKQLALLNHSMAIELAESLAAIKGVRVLNEAFFNEFTLELPVPAVPLVEKLAKQGILAGVPLARLYPKDASMNNRLLVAATETTTREHIQQLSTALSEALA
ncbi:MAG: aminomethyl-transferring glycine dehydrogenase subunit GcvPA [Alphaproteobacteria bacterium]